MKRIVRKIVGLAVMVAALAVVAGAMRPALAQTDGMSITMSPLSMRIDIAAGTVTDGAFSVANNGTEAYDFTVYAQPYTVSADTYQAQFDDEEAPRAQLYRWISFDQESYHLEAGEQIEVSYHVATPDSIPAGSQYAVIFAQVAQENQQAGIQASSRVGTTIFARGDGETIEKGSVVEQSLAEMQTIDDVSAVRAREGFWYTAGPLYTTVRVQNEGNTDFDATTKLELTNYFGDGVVAVSDEQTRAVFPDTTRTIEDKLGCATGEVGTATAGSACVDLPAIGLFWLTETVTYMGKTESFRHFVMILPVWMVWLAIVVVVVIVGLIIRSVRMRNKNRKRRGNHETDK